MAYRKLFKMKQLLVHEKICCFYFLNCDMCFKFVKKDESVLAIKILSIGYEG